MATVAQKLVRGASYLNRVSKAVPIAVTATANTDITFTLPAGARDVTFRTKTATAFGAATDATLQIGSASAGAEFVAAVSVKAQGQVAHTLVGGGVATLDTVAGTPGTETIFYVRIVQTGTASATGAATLFADFAVPVA